MISSTTIQLHAPDGLKANRNGEYKEVSVFYKNVKQAGHSYLISIPPPFSWAQFIAVKLCWKSQNNTEPSKYLKAATKEFFSTAIS